MALDTWAGGTVLEAPRTALRLDGDSCSAEASTLGLAPGEWPTLVGVPARDGHRIYFHLMGLARDAEGDVTHGHYTARGGTLLLSIWND